MTKVQELRNVETKVKELLDELELKERIESTVKEQLKELSNFYRISESLTTGGNITTILDEICNLVSCIRGVDGAWIGLVGDDGETIFPAANRKVPSELLRPRRIDERDSPVTESLEMGKVTIIDSCEEPERFSKWCSRISGAGYDSAAVFPLTFGDTITGVMVVLSCRQEYFVPETLPLFQMYANQTSFAVRAAQQDEHLRLYEQKASFHEKEYRLFLDRLSEAVFILDTTLSCTYCNRSFELLAKKEMEDIVGKKMTPHFGRKDSRRIRSALKLCLDGTNSSFMSVASGGEKILEVDLNPVRAEDGTVIGVIGVARDISEMERAAKLDESVEELNQEVSRRAWMIDNSPTGVLMIEPDGTIVQVNPAGAKLLNSRIKKCIGTPVYSFFFEKEREALASAIATALHSGESRAESVISIDGDEKSLSLRCRRRRAKGGDLVAVYLSDVNEQSIIRENLASISSRFETRGKELEHTLIELRKREHDLESLNKEAEALKGEIKSLENERERAKEHLDTTTKRLKRRGKELEHTLIELRRKEAELERSGQAGKRLAGELQSLKEDLVQSDSALLIMDAESGRIIETNKAAMELFDYSADEFSTMSLGELMTPANGPEETVRKILNGTYCPFECSKLSRKDGSLLTCSVTSSSFQTPEGKLLAVIITDTSKQKRMKSQFELIANQLEIVKETLKDDSSYEDVEEYTAALAQRVAPEFDSLGLHSVRIILEGTAYGIDEDSYPGKDFSSEILFGDKTRGTLHVRVSEELVDDSEEGIPTKAFQQSMDLFAHIIGWMAERIEMDRSLDEKRRQLTNLKEVVERQREMSDGLQAVQSSACLLLEKSGNVDSTDRARLNVIDEHVTEIRQMFKEMSSISDTIQWDLEQGVEVQS